MNKILSETSATAPVGRDVRALPGVESEAGQARFAAADEARRHSEAVRGDIEAPLGVA